MPGGSLGIALDVWDYFAATGAGVRRGATFASIRRCGHETATGSRAVRRKNGRCHDPPDAHLSPARKLPGETYARSLWRGMNERPLARSTSERNQSGGLEARTAEARGRSISRNRFRAGDGLRGP
jgi:hypothetical protein